MKDIHSTRTRILYNHLSWSSFHLSRDASCNINFSNLMTCSPAMLTQFLGFLAGVSSVVFMVFACIGFSCGVSKVYSNNDTLISNLFYFFSYLPIKCFVRSDVQNRALLELTLFDTYLVPIIYLPHTLTLVTLLLSCLLFLLLLLFTVKFNVTFTAFIVSAVGPDMLAEWGYTYAIAAVQDVFACSPLMVFILYGLTMMSVRPQLQQIYHVLNNIAITRMQDGFQMTSDFRLVHHLSGACRATAYTMDTSLSSTQVKHLLIQLHVVFYFPRRLAYSCVLCSY